MKHLDPRRALGAAALAGTVALLAGACASTPQPAPDRAASESATPGSLSARIDGGPDHPGVTITGATVRPGANGDGELTMTVRNDGSTPEHLSMASAAVADSVELQGGGPYTDSPAGVLLPPGSTATFGAADGPHVVLHGLHGLTPGADVPVTLIFARLGLVHLQALPAS
ncbi:copper chaperone PCu(A)C [Kitasatospora sp. NPDC052896]|uniref:copper chaperone PCu(A)C n=1 Tax=Kitasatospora sp. NPDC052896 TaxID=3364061 RepID=UPI0037C5D4F5